MEKWEFSPLVSVGKIKFGMNRAEIHALFGEKRRVIKKTKYRKHEGDDYGRFHVYYTPDNTVKTVVIFEGEGIELTLNGDVIFPIKFSEIEKVMPGIERDVDLYIDIEKSICYGDGEEMPECITVGDKDYFS